MHNIRIQIPHDADDDSGEEDVEEEDQEDVPGLRCSWVASLRTLVGLWCVDYLYSHACLCLRLTRGSLSVSPSLCLSVCLPRLFRLSLSLSLSLVSLSLSLSSLAFSLSLPRPVSVCDRP